MLAALIDLPNVRTTNLEPKLSVQNSDRTFAKKKIMTNEITQKKA